MSEALKPEHLTQAVGGDIASFGLIQGEPQRAIDQIRDQLTGLTLTPAAILRVLVAFERKQISADQVQAWTSFVRRGYIPTSTQAPLQPVKIDYEHLHED
jgi:hypothetical protein